MSSSFPVDVTPSLIRLIRERSRPLRNSADLQPLMDLIGDARFVLLGEASHGTHEYYSWRTHISKRLIAEKNFSFIAIEGDWPDSYRLNRYVKDYADSGASAREVLGSFNRWPTWMWANWETVALGEWLRKYNTGRSLHAKAGFYGLDVYSLWESLDELYRYLEKTDPLALKYLRRAVACFEPFADGEGLAYARATSYLPVSCEREVENLLATVRRQMPVYNTDREAVFSAEQNALIAVNAEHYYRIMIRGDSESWNVRDRHMAETLDRLMTLHGPESKAIVWAHNTHIGDARATDMYRSGMINIGQLLQDEHDREGVVRVGFGSYQGTVVAGSEWGAAMKKMELPPGRPSSWEDALHRAGSEDKLLLTRDLEDARGSIGHRAVGVVYDPRRERLGNYVPSIIPERYEAFLFIDRTQALHPLHIQPDGHQIPETYPWGV